MPIVSISLNEEMMGLMEKMRSELGYSGRSELIRAALGALLADSKDKLRLKGESDAVLVVLHHSRHSEGISKIEHKYRDIIKTQVHNCTQNNKCLETFVLHGGAERMLSMSDELEKSKKAEIAKLIVP